MTGKTVIDEDLSGLFSERIDSATSTWFVKNAFRSDSVEVSLIDSYPKNLPDSIYIQRLQETEQVIDLSFNPAVLSFIKMYSERKRDQVERMIGLSEYYFPMFEEILDKYNLPLELKYLSIIESALDPVATSSAGALGLWQFMYGTAKLLNMEITSFVDERRDPVKSSEAAAIYLKKLFGIYNDWHLAIAAYNCGPGNVDRAIKRSGGKTGYWDIYYLLPRETRGYVPLFIAATYVMNFYGEHNLIPRVPAMPTVVDTIMVNKYLHFDQISATLNIEKEHLQALNPMYKRGVIPGSDKKSYPLVLPQTKAFEFIEKDTAVFAYERTKYFPNNTLVNAVEKSSGKFTPADIDGKTKIVYTVKAGDTVGGISKKYKVRASDLTYWNNIKKNIIRTGQKLAIYVPETNKVKQEKAVVQKSENSTQPAASATAIAEQNSTAIADYEMYTVKKGDNVGSIAQKFDGVSGDDIIQLNNIKNVRGLSVGQKLKIPKKS
ncbi:MAG TPA: transglycosylase SLT domain-containing protein [Draconibacterium sp.]|nr:transglycosylase SLT domain-containing protein [Draconibacterium sp.]